MGTQQLRMRNTPANGYKLFDDNTGITFMKPFQEPEQLLSSVRLAAPCEDCGKPRTKEPKGSITGWIFGNDYRAITDRWSCSCAASRQSDTADGSKSERHAESDALPAELIATAVAGRWKIVSQLSSGRIGTSYVAEELETLAPVVIKIVRRELNSNPRITKRILQECQKSAQLAHKNICLVQDSGKTEQGDAYIVMEHITGGSLAARIEEEGFLDCGEALDMAIQISQALQYAHEMGVLHRGVKPANVLFCSHDGTVKLTDFGIAKAIPSLGSETVKLSTICEVFGDPSCMSPEQCLGRELDERSDVYSLGCVIYQALTGKPPYQCTTGFEIARAHVTEEPRPFRKAMYNCEIPATVEAVVMRALQKDPADRYQSMAQLQSDLETCARGGTPQIPPPKRQRKTPSLVAEEKPLEDPGQKDQANLTKIKLRISKSGEVAAASSFGEKPDKRNFRLRAFFALIIIASSLFCYSLSTLSSLSTSHHHAPASAANNERKTDDSTSPQTSANQSGSAKQAIARPEDWLKENTAESKEDAQIRRQKHTQFRKARVSDDKVNAFIQSEFSPSNARIRDDYCAALTEKLKDRFATAPVLSTDGVGMVQFVLDRDGTPQIVDELGGDSDINALRELVKNEKFQSPGTWRTLTLFYNRGKVLVEDLGV